MSKIIKAISIVALCACLFCAAIAFGDTPTTSAASKPTYECARLETEHSLTSFLNSKHISSENIIYIGAEKYDFDVEYVVIYKK